jgi:putative redox protein
MEAKVTWQKNLVFTGTSDSGFELPLDTKASAGGEGNGFQPMELFAIGLAGCTALDVISILNKKRQEVTAFEVQAHVERAAEHPKVFTSGVIEYFVSGHCLDEAALVRSIELSAGRYCPAQAMLGMCMPIELKYHIFEDLGEGERRLVTSGIYSNKGEQVGV